MNEEIREKSAKILSVALGKTIDPWSQLKREDSAEWDSLKHIEMVLMLEDEFKIRFSSEDVNHMRSLDQIVKAVTAKYGP